MENSKGSRPNDPGTNCMSSEASWHWNDVVKNQVEAIEGRNFQVEEAHDLLRGKMESDSADRDLEGFVDLPQQRAEEVDVGAASLLSPSVLVAERLLRDV